MWVSDVKSSFKMKHIRRKHILPAMLALKRYYGISNPMEPDSHKGWGGLIVLSIIVTFRVCSL